MHYLVEFSLISKGLNSRLNILSVEKFIVSVVRRNCGILKEPYPGIYDGPQIFGAVR